MAFSSWPFTHGRWFFFLFNFYFSGAIIQCLCPVNQFLSKAFFFLLLLDRSAIFAAKVSF